MKKNDSKKISFEITYTHKGHDVVAFVKLRSGPIINDKIKYGVIGDPKYYSFEDLGKLLSNVPFKKNDNLYLFVVNIETGQREEFRINISKEWPHDLPEDTIRKTRMTVDISKPINKIGI